VYEALYLLMERMDRFDLVLIEAKMPDMDSYDFMHYATYKINIPVIGKYIYITICITISHD
jgi:CheY-like chemotaxis protein